VEWPAHGVVTFKPFARLRQGACADQTVYLSQPPGYIAEGKEDFVWKLGKGSMASSNLVTSGTSTPKAFLS